MLLPDLIGSDGVCVLDGGLATELEARGADLADRLWSARLLLDDPELIRQVHLAYFAAGADVATSSSYQASFEGFASRGIDRDRATGLMRRSVELARSAADEHRAHDPDRRPLVAASVGPYGAMLADGSEYVGRYGVSQERLRAFHRPRLEVLLEARPDLLAIETIPSIEEAAAILELLEEVPGPPAWIAFSCRDGRTISDGTPFVEAVRLAASSKRVVAVGVNCSPPELVAELVEGASEVTAELLAYPNAGRTWDATARRWTLDTGAHPDLGALATSWREAGVPTIGGCCGTTPDDIGAIVAAVGRSADRP